MLSLERRTSENKNSVKQLSHYSINRTLSALRAYLRYLADSDYGSPLVSENIKLLQLQKRNIKHAKTDDLIKLIESPTRLESNKKVGLRNMAMLEVLFSTGIRLSELLNLKRDQINKSGEILISNKHKGERLVYLTHRAKSIVEKYLSSRLDDSPYVFIPYSGKHASDKIKQITPSYLQRKIKEYRERLMIDSPISAQWLTTDGFANYLVEQNLNPRPIKSISAHESLDTTTRYVQASDRYAQKIHKKYHPLKE